MSPKAQLEQEKRIRREIANSNERRRMQCINAGFQSLRALMPQLSGEKLSKVRVSLSVLTVPVSNKLGWGAGGLFQPPNPPREENN